MPPYRLRPLVRPALVLAGLAGAALVVSIAAGAGQGTRLQQAGLIANLPSSVRATPNPPAAEHQDVSPPLADIAPAPRPHPGEKREHRERPVPGPAPGLSPDPVVQTTKGPTRLAPTAGAAF